MEITDGYKIKTSKFLKHVKDSGGIVIVIAKRLGVARTSLVAWLNRNPSMWDYIYQEREEIIDIAEAQLLKKLNDGQDWAIKFVLANTNIGKARGYSLTDTPAKFGNSSEPNYRFELVRPEESEEK